MPRFLANGLMPGTVCRGPFGRRKTLGLHRFLPFLVLFGGTGYADTGYTKRGSLDTSSNTTAMRSPAEVHPNAVGRPLDRQYDLKVKNGALQISRHPSSQYLSLLRAVIECHAPIGV